MTSSESGQRMRVFHQDMTDFAVAPTPEEAFAAWCEHIGEEPLDQHYTAWEALDDDEPLTIWIDDEGHVAPVDDDHAAPETMTAAAWAARFERPAFLASTEA